MDKLSLPGVSPPAAKYLRLDNPRLHQLQTLYAALPRELTAPLEWTDDYQRREIPDLLSFRGDNAYVWQVRGRTMNELAYTLTYYYVKTLDRLQLLSTLREDFAFGVVTFEIAGQRISRDLLDSILEIYFLDGHLGITKRSELSVLDIGAGYGRLAHRMLSACPKIGMYACTDAVALSSFLCDYYLGYRRLRGRAKVVDPLAVGKIVDAYKISLGINVHSFSECSLEAVEWWLGLLSRHGVEHLMIVPNAGCHGGGFLLNNSNQDMFPVIQRKGYSLLCCESKFQDALVQEYGINPTCYWLFQLR